MKTLHKKITCNMRFNYKLLDKMFYKQVYTGTHELRKVRGREENHRKHGTLAYFYLLPLINPHSPFFLYEDRRNTTLEYYSCATL